MNLPAQAVTFCLDQFSGGRSPPAPAGQARGTILDRESAQEVGGDPVNPAIGFLGSSNLTLAGLSRQGELNVDVMDHDGDRFVDKDPLLRLPVCA